MNNNYNTIVNPATNRKVNVNGKIGKRVLKNYLKQKGGAGYVYNAAAQTGQSLTQGAIKLSQCNNEFRNDSGQWANNLRQLEPRYCLNCARQAAKRGQSLKNPALWCRYARVGTMGKNERIFLCQSCKEYYESDPTWKQLLLNDYNLYKHLTK